MKHLYIIRHGRTDFNDKGIVQGRGVNSTLNAKGFIQSHAFHKAYRHHPFELVITSSLQRTKQTVQPFIEQGIPHLEFSELDEVGWGIFEGQPTTDRFHRDYHETLTQWGLGNYHARTEAGESLHELHQRLLLWVDDVLHNLPQRQILICTHGAVLGTLLTIFRGEAPKEMARYRHSNTGLCKLIQQEPKRFHLELQDDVSHLG